ncbi:MAG: hypothetical protein HOV77_30755 [Hamadaea sp.]|uniref:hypothetical protein n=1 Tax=Hamadaea sp. TaxID=2024425 RepID=UPI00180E1295|nr:hypothetical protein [Hamadaea sp.]NUT23568.1 hypothetical protein [Hamadaea sp.]
MTAETITIEHAPEGRQPEDVEEYETRAIGDFRLVALLIGAVLAGAIAASSPHNPDDSQEMQRWVIYVLIGALMGAAAGEGFGFGISRWREVVRIRPISFWRVLPMLILVVAIAVGLMRLTPVISSAVTPRGWALSLIAIVGALPLAATLTAVQLLTRRKLPGSVGHQLGTLLWLRRTVSRMLSELGVIVLLVMAVNRAAVEFGDKQDPIVVIFAGAIGSFVVGIMYVPAATTLRRRASTYVQRNFTLDGVPQAELVGAAEDLGKLEKLLGLDQTTFGDLRSGLVILTPFVVSALSALLPKF